METTDKKPNLKAKDLNKAQKLIQEDKQERAEKAKEALQKICKDFNIHVEQGVVIDGKTIPVRSIIGLPIVMIVTPL